MSRMRFYLWLLILAVPISQPAAAARTLTYSVYAGGLNVVTAKIDLDDSAPGRYHVTLSAWTQGLLGKLVPWKGSFETEGWRLKDGDERPEIYKSSSVWHKKEEIKQFTYSRDGKFVGFKKSEAGKDTTPKTFDKKLADGTTDSLTATLLVMDKVGRGGKCEGSRDVFDGLRRFKLAFRDEGDEVLDKTNYNVYAGPAARCTVEVTPDGGVWHEKPRGWLSIQEQGRQKGSLPAVWMAKIGGSGPALPVKIRVVTDYGTLFMQLSDYQTAAAPTKSSPKNSGP
jgi:hypothetical protein